MFSFIQWYKYNSYKEIEEAKEADQQDEMTRNRKLTSRKFTDIVGNPDQHSCASKMIASLDMNLEVKNFEFLKTIQNQSRKFHPRTMRRSYEVILSNKFRICVREDIKKCIISMRKKSLKSSRNEISRIWSVVLNSDDYASNSSGSSKQWFFLIPQTNQFQ